MATVSPLVPASVRPRTYVSCTQFNGPCVFVAFAFPGVDVQRLHFNQFRREQSEVLYRVPAFAGPWPSLFIGDAEKLTTESR